MAPRKGSLSYSVSPSLWEVCRPRWRSGSALGSSVRAASRDWVECTALVQRSKPLGAVKGSKQRMASLVSISSQISPESLSVIGAPSSAVRRPGASPIAVRAARHERSDPLTDIVIGAGSFAAVIDFDGARPVLAGERELHPGTLTTSGSPHHARAG